ncbi:MAG: phosphoserine phosphatase [Kordiimonas sp.]|nr:phosphoserine phosphatase [Kordiimonas sp.]
MSELKRTALIYDYDGTLARGNIQENSFLPALDIDVTDFWGEVKKLTKENDADEVLVYMQLMLKKAKERDIAVTKEKLREHGESSELFDGLMGQTSWFQRLNEFACERGLDLEHYILSSGTQEMIEGSKICKEFKKVFASCYIYNEKDEAEWPGLAINYTTKTQFLFRINKGINNAWNNDDINVYMPENERPIPFSRMMFIGDGDTDIPAMKMTTHYGGHSIAVYDPERDTRSLGKIHRLISDGRVNFVAPADYSENSQMEILVKGIIGRIARAEGYRPQERE